MGSINIIKPLLSTALRSNVVNKHCQHWINFGNARNQTRNSRVGSSNATSVQCCPTVPNISLSHIHFFACSALISATDGAAMIFPTTLCRGVGLLKTHVRRITPRPRTLWRMLYRLSYSAAYLPCNNFISLGALCYCEIRCYSLMTHSSN